MCPERVRKWVSWHCENLEKIISRYSDLSRNLLYFLYSVFFPWLWGTPHDLSQVDLLLISVHTIGEILKTGKNRKRLHLDQMSASLVTANDSRIFSRQTADNTCFLMSAAGNGSLSQARFEPPQLKERAKCGGSERTAIPNKHTFVCWPLYDETEMTCYI